LDDAIQKANDSLKTLDAATEFTLLVTKAESGDRAAFFKLKKTPGTQLSMANATESIIGAILTKIQVETALKETSVRPIWNSLGIDPEKASLQQLREYYSAADVLIDNQSLKVTSTSLSFRIRRNPIIAMNTQTNFNSGLLRLPVASQ
jgi:hypothetical protein